MKDGVLLSTAYWGPIQYYTKLYAAHSVWIEVWEHYIKQTYRNRCLIASPNGIQALTVPIIKPETDKCPIKDIRISDHGNWRHLHWNALDAAYRNSPFFEYYVDDFLPFYTQKWTFLIDFNDAIQQKVCELIDIVPNIKHTSSFGTVEGRYKDYRTCISPKETFAEDTAFRTVPYYQVFQKKQSFQPNLSIADLLFNMGPESLIILNRSIVYPS